AVRHEAGSGWFARALGAGTQLVCMPDDARRAVDPEYARDGDVVSFADGFPLLIANRASIVALGSASGAVDMRRFRPNLVVTGADAWAEDAWRAIAIGDGALTLRTPKPCARCSIPGVDPDSAAITKEPLRTLARLRTRDHKTWFGINAIPDGNGVVRVGDPVRALDK
ncbi:MAG TPA: MOSC domain-containing protein, partial [Polyangia bacterium]